MSTYYKECIPLAMTIHCGIDSKVENVIEIEVIGNELRYVYTDGEKQLQDSMLLTAMRYIKSARPQK